MRLKWRHRLGLNVLIHWKKHRWGKLWCAEHSKTMLPLHSRGRSERLHEKLLLGVEGNRHNEQPVNTQFRISEKLPKNGKTHFLEPERRNHPMPSKCSQRGDFEVNNKEVDSKCSPSALQIKSCCLKNTLQNRVPPPQWPELHCFGTSQTSTGIM